jgi:carboxylesterase type B
MKPVSVTDELLPLVIFVHGGGYQGGTDLIHIQDYMAEYYVLNGIVYATVHYRMGITGKFPNTLVISEFIGLASSGDSDFGGNYALWDVREALLWLRKNSEQLGVDRERITFWGYSAGASVSINAYIYFQFLDCCPLGVESPDKRLVFAAELNKLKRLDLFQQSIQMSGASINEWSYSNISAISTHLVGEKLNCQSADLKKCLQQVTIEQLHDAVQKIVTLKKVIT